MDYDDTPAMICDCQERELQLSEWERDFIQSIDEQYRKTGGLSERQVEILEKIWERVT